MPLIEVRSKWQCVACEHVVEVEGCFRPEGWVTFRLSSDYDGSGVFLKVDVCDTCMPKSPRKPTPGFWRTMLDKWQLGKRQHARKT